MDIANLVPIHCNMGAVMFSQDFFVAVTLASFAALASGATTCYDDSPSAFVSTADGSPTTVTYSVTNSTLSMTAYTSGVSQHINQTDAPHLTNATITLSSTSTHSYLHTRSPTETTHTQWEQPHRPRPTANVTVGAAGALIFSPSTLDASIGTIIRFDFLKLNHTLTQSIFKNPCHSDGRFDSGFQQFNPRNITGKFIVEFEVTTEEPQWFFCAQNTPRSHCNAGMVFSLNSHGAHQSFVRNALAAATASRTIFSSASACIIPSYQLVTASPSTGVASSSHNSTLLAFKPTVPPSPLITNTGSGKLMATIRLLFGLTFGMFLL